jgi:hypothetical protein
MVTVDVVRVVMTVCFPFWVMVEVAGQTVVVVYVVMVVTDGLFRCSRACAAAGWRALARAVVAKAKIVNAVLILRDV